jgi:hypothetical protein
MLNLAYLVQHGAPSRTILYHVHVQLPHVCVHDTFKQIVADGRAFPCPACVVECVLVHGCGRVEGAVVHA